MHGIALSDARVGTAGVIASVELPDEVSHHLAHLGFLPGTGVEVLRRAPAGDPTVYRIDGVEVGLRNETAQHIFLEVHADGLDRDVESAAEPEQSASAGEIRRSFATLRMTALEDAELTALEGTELTGAAR